jgi:hypothetical protein
VKRTLLLVALVVGGCGAGTPKETPPKPPRLPRALAHDWAAKADAVASALAAGDGCTARTRAAALQQQVIAAVNERRVPRRLLEPLMSGVNALASQITCTPPPPVVRDEGKPRGPKHDHGPGHGHRHDRPKHGKHD